MPDKKLQILVLPSWYPSKLDVFAGDFVKRHVEAISQVHNQHIIFIVKDEEGKLTKDVLETKQQFDNYTEVIIYYHVRKSGLNLFDKIRSDMKYRQLYKKHLHDLIVAEGKPAICHVHIAMKAGLAAIWLKIKYKIPFVVTEHWSGYLGEAVPNLSDKNHIFRKRTRSILAMADAVTAVSAHLAASLEKLFPPLQPLVVPNVINTAIFYPQQKQKNSPVKFIHASTMTHPKNIKKIAEALLDIKSKGYKFQMNFFGPIQHDVIKVFEKMGLLDCVLFKGDVSQIELASEMQGADAMIQFSVFETFSCVVIEANAAGIPVFISDIPALRELVTDNKNGYIVKADDTRALAKKIIAFIDGELPVDKDLISAKTEKFSYSTVAKRFSKVYFDIINSA